MNTLRRWLMTVGLMAGLTTLAMPAFAQQLSAQEAVDRYITALLTRMDDIRPLFDSDRETYFNEVEVALTDLVDFREVARGVMAKYSQGPRGATPEQLDRFAEVFRASLVDFYGSALAGFDGVEYEFKENPQADRDSDRSTNILMDVKGQDGDAISVQYTMFLNDDKVWKLRNLYVEGVNLRRQYYSRFDNLMNRNDFDIDKVIDLWGIDE